MTEEVRLEVHFKILSAMGREAYVLIMPDTEGDEHVVCEGSFRDIIEWMLWLDDFEHGHG